MNRSLELREIPDLPDEIRQAALDGDLVLFVGAGVSMLVNLPSWLSLASKALEELRQKGFLNYSDVEQLKALDPRKQLSIAELICSENSIPFELAKYLTTHEVDQGIYIYLNKIGCPCVTTNYDVLLRPHYYSTKDGSSTEVPISRFDQKQDLLAGHLNTPGTVVHLHGSVVKPETMVVTTKQYLEHYEDETVQAFLGELFQKKTILFIGYGLEEVEILEHILRKGRAHVTGNRRRLALMPFFISQAPLYERLHEYYERSFGVHLIGYVRDHKDYQQLEEIMKTWSGIIEVRPTALASELDFMDEVLG